MYYVIMSHNFDAQTCIYEFEEYDKAIAFLHWDWENYYNEELSEGSGLDEEECYHEDEYAQVKWEDGCQTEWNLVEGLDEPSPEFEEEWERYV